MNLKNYRESMGSAYGNKYIKEADRLIKIEIGDIPVLRSDDKKIICLAKERIENLKIGIFGQTGAGRTSLLLSIMSRMYWSKEWNTDCCVLNDYQSESNLWNQGNFDFERELRLLSEVPFPTPTVLIYPQNKDTPEFKEMNQGLSVPHIRETIPFSRIIEDITQYVKMGKNTERYWLTLRDKLKTCTDLNEVREKIKELGVGEKGVNVKGSIFSMLTSIDELEKEGYIDIVAGKKYYDHSGSPSSKIKIQKGDEIEEGPIFSMLMKYHYIPILRTEDLLHLRYAEPFLTDKTEEIFRYPRWMDYKRRCMVFVPEISKFIGFKEVMKKIEDITGRGRAKGVGICYDTHSYDEVRKVLDKKIIQNTVFAFAFAQKAETASSMKSDFDLDEKDKDQIINLKQFQCLAISSKGEKWAIYDQNGERSLKSGTFRGYPLPSLCQHQRGNIK